MCTPSEDDALVTFAARRILWQFLKDFQPVTERK
jgi:hypothetical protein